MSTTFAAEDRFLTQREAVELSDVSLNAVKKAMRQKIIAPRHRNHRVLLSPEFVGGLELLARTRVVLPIDKKKKVVNWAAKRPKSGEVLKLDEVLFVKADDAFVKLMDDVLRYVKLRAELIKSDPEIAGGEPVIRGSRVPVRSLAHQIELGESLEVLREDYPHLPEEAFELAPVWARAHPRTGRPLKS